VNLRGLDSYLTREPPEPTTEPHAPWVVMFVTVEGDHWNDDSRGERGSWAVEHGGDDCALTTFVIGSYEDAFEAARRCNLRYFEHVPSLDGEWCTVCGDYLGEVVEDMGND
jgi:hypothetical protein